MRIPLVSLSGAAAFAALLLGSAPSISAQNTSVDRERPNVIYINPIGAVFGLFTGEYERKLNSSISLGVAGTYWDKPTGIDQRYNSFDARIRFYPQERAPRGFAVGLLFGVVSFDEEQTSCSGPGCVRKSTTNAAFGFQADYTWLLGPTQRFAVGTGFGAKRLIGKTGGDTQVIPTGRFNIGYTF